MFACKVGILQTMRGQMQLCCTMSPNVSRRHLHIVACQETIQVQKFRLTAVNTYGNKSAYFHKNPVTVS
jgi:hypothetical protein